MEDIKEEKIVSEEEFRRRLGSFQQYNPEAVRTFKSTGRAARRGHLMKSGMIVPKRPFHNRKNTSKRKGVHSRTDNELKKEMWDLIKIAAQNAQQ